MRILWCNFAMQHDIAKIMASHVIQLKGKFDVYLAVNLQTRFIAYW